MLGYINMQVCVCVFRCLGECAQTNKKYVYKWLKISLINKKNLILHITATTATSIAINAAVIHKLSADWEATR